MDWLLRAVRSSVGRKFFVGVTGLGLVGFLVGHLTGNMHMLQGAERMNEYAHFLHHIPMFGLIELGLFACFVGHIGLALSLAPANRAARGNTRYAVSGTKRAGGDLQRMSSGMMALSGVIILVFLVVHLSDFRAVRHTIETDTMGIGYVVVDKLSEWWRAGLYALGSLLLSWHLFHGIQSAARSAGLNHPKYTPLVEKGGAALSIVLGLGFAGLALLTAAGVISYEGIGGGDDAPAVEAPAADESTADEADEH